MSGTINFSFCGDVAEFLDLIHKLAQLNKNVDVPADVPADIAARPSKSVAKTQVVHQAKFEKTENKEMPLFEAGRSDPLTPDLQHQVQTEVQNSSNKRYNFPREYGEKIVIPPATSFDPDVAKLWHDFIVAFAAGIIDDQPHPELPNDRVAMVTALAGNRLHGKLLQEIVAVGGVQCAIRNILRKSSESNNDGFLSDEVVNKVASVLIQISHVALPELADLYDYSSKWRRES